MDSHLEQAKRLIAEAVHGMSPAQLAWHPPEKWSSAEVLEHLALAFGGTAIALGKVARSGQSAATPQNLKQKIGTLLIAGFGYFPAGRKSPEMVAPKGAPPEQIVSTILANLEKMDAAIAECEQSLGASQKIANHPVLGALNARQWRRFHLVHTRHHMKQVRGLRKQQNLPTSGA